MSTQEYMTAAELQDNTDLLNHGIYVSVQKYNRYLSI